MRIGSRAAAAAGVISLLVACSSEDPAGSAPRGTAPPPSTAPSAADVPALTAVRVQPLDGTGTTPFDQPRTLQAPPGWTVDVWARVPAARLLAWTPDGRLLVSRPKHGDVLALTPGAGAATQQTLVSGLNQPHGLAFRGDTLFVAESDKVDSFRYARGTVTDKRVVVGGLPDDKSPELRGAYSHALKSVAVGDDGALYVSVGSTGNVSVEDRDATPERASILRVPPGGGQPTTYARGVRNGTGLAVDPAGSVWTAVNHRDNIGYPHEDGAWNRGDVVQEYVNDHPFEQLARLTPGRELGWPYCNPDPDLQPGEKDSPLSYTQRPYVADVQLNPDGSKLDCGSLVPVEQGMGAHSAPLGLSFAVSPGLSGGYGPGALVGIHGSWNRKPPRAPEVSFFAWRDGGLGPQQTLLTGFQLPDGSRWGRPVMAVQGPDGALYVSDDQAGAVYRVAAA
ncbi:PQQ-dependent sugar dehydrogenase [Actinoplanes rectilineatus]|uniref:PQQ-dependent sugar dehydrogenase n=1 Tax=Actinoplanes rectilineatus TaxID=113571 RepID=UPI0007C754AB|nr:hypothetical protein [Actinoplanes rectilineatus]